MLQKARTFATTIHNFVHELTPLEHRILAVSMVVLSVFCLVFHDIMRSLVQLLGYPRNAGQSGIGQVL
jgi:hypothetical protein